MKRDAGIVPGRTAMRRRIRSVLEAGEDDVYSTEAGGHVVPGLLELLAPERARIQRRMAESIRAMLQLIYG